MIRRRATLWTPLLALTLLAAAPGHAGWEECRGWEADSDWGDRGRYCEIRELELPALSALEVDATPNGGIRVEAWDRDEIRVEARLSIWNESESEARRIAAGVEILSDGGRLRADGDDEKGWSVGFRIRAPRRIDLDLESHNGGISVVGIEGRLRLETHNGGLSLSALAGDVVARTLNGGVDLELEGDRWLGSGLDVETRNGGINLDIPESYSAELETGTVNGRVRIDFPVTVEGEIGRKLSTTLGAGGAPIRVRTTNGSVEINKS